MDNPEIIYNRHRTQDNTKKQARQDKNKHNTEN